MYTYKAFAILSSGEIEPWSVLLHNNWCGADSVHCFDSCVYLPIYYFVLFACLILLYICYVSVKEYFINLYHFMFTGVIDTCFY